MNRAEYYREWRRKHGKVKIERYGNCLDCGKPTTGNHWYCEEHRKLRRAETCRISSNRHYHNYKQIAELAK